MKKVLSVLLFVAILLSVGVLSSCNDNAKKTQPHTKQYIDLFNTVSVIYSYAEDDRDTFDKNCTLAETVLYEYHRLFDIYYEYDGINNLATVNRMAGRGPVKVDKKLIDFLIYCKDLYVLTDGHTNVALGAVLSMWHDARTNADDFDVSVPPSYESLKEASLHTSIDSIVINEEESTVEITDSLLSIDVGAIGKGYAVEKAKDVLISEGASSYVLNVGGNIAAIGTKPSGEGWKTAIKNPKDPTLYALYVDLTDITCVTSGSYERYFLYEGKRYHHVIDPDTLMPSEYFESVTVIADDSGLADALSTALFCMSYEDGLELISSIEGADAVWIYNTGEIKCTSGIKRLS